jgi:SAM-dependent methyltransferase
MPRPKAEEIDSFYKNTTYGREDTDSPQDRFALIMNQEEFFPNSTVDAARISATCRHWTSGDRFLDVGAGYGFFSKAAIERGFQVTALEPALAYQEVFKMMNGFDPFPNLLNEEFVTAHTGEFDVILMSQVLEHVRDLDWTLSALRSLLRDGGIAAIAVPHFRSLISILQGRRDMFIAPPEHLNYFTSKGLKRLFRRHGFITLTSHTVSRINGRRIAGKLRLGFLGGPLSCFSKMVLPMMDLVKMGMFLNCYFRKGATNTGAPTAAKDCS